MLNSLSAEVKALWAKFEGLKHMHSSITSTFSVLLSYSIKSSASVEIPDPVAAEDVIKNVHNPKSCAFFE